MKSFKFKNVSKNREFSVKAVVFCSWSNVRGPRIVNVWRCSHECSLSHLVLQRIATEALNGEIGLKNVKRAHIKRFAVEKDTLVTSYVFNSYYCGRENAHAIAFVTMPRFTRRLHQEAYFFRSLERFMISSKIQVIHCIKYATCLFKEQIIIFYYSASESF